MKVWLHINSTRATSVQNCQTNLDTALSLSLSLSTIEQCFHEREILFPSFFWNLFQIYDSVSRVRPPCLSQRIILSFTFQIIPTDDSLPEHSYVIANSRRGRPVNLVGKTVRRTDTRTCSLCRNIDALRHRCSLFSSSSRCLQSPLTVILLRHIYDRLPFSMSVFHLLCDYKLATS